MLRVAASRVLGVNASLYRDPAIDERYNSQLVDWEDYIVGSYLTTVCKLAQQNFQYFQLVYQIRNLTKI